MGLLYLISKLIKKIHIPSIKNSSVDKTSKVCSGSNILNVNIGRYSYIGSNCTVVNAEIGSFCSIAENCIIGGANHPMEWVSTSPVFHNGKNILKTNFSRHNFELTKNTKVGNDVWIGSNCLIKSGVSIGDGSVIGMGSIVTKNVGQYEIVAGNPAKIIRKRFGDDTIEELLQLKWWEFSDTDLIKCAEAFNNVNAFIQKNRARKTNEDTTLG